MAHQLGAVYNLPHGVCCAMLLPVVERENAKRVPVAFRNVAKALGMQIEGKSDEECAAYAISEIEKLSETVGIPKKLTELGIEEKIQYINKTKIKIKDLRNLNKVSDIIEIVQELFKNKQVEINAENLNYYWNTIQESDKKNSELEEAVDKFVGTMNSIISGRLIKHNKTNDIKLKNSIFSKCEAICNELINISTVSDTLFKIIINHAQQPIAQLNSNLSDDRIKVLIKENKILPNEDNIKIIIDKSLDEEIKTLAETNEKEVLPLLIKMELSDETIYSVVNSNVSTDNAKSLLTKLNGSVQIDKINPEKTELIESIQNENL